MQCQRQFQFKSSGKSIKANAESKNFRYRNKNQVIIDDVIKIKQN